MQAEPFNYPPSAHSAARIRELLFILRAHPLASSVKVFGSATYKDSPKDLDVMIEVEDVNWTVALSAFLILSSSSFQRTQRTGEYGSAMQGRFHGLFDPFVKVEGQLYTRNEDGSGWVRARKAGEIMQAGVNGVPLIGTVLPVERYSSQNS